MKKLILAIATLTTTLTFGQWTNRTVNNDFDPEYRIAYNRALDGTLLKLEDDDGELAFYVQNTYTCSDQPIVDLVFIFADGTKEVYELQCVTSSDREAVFMSADLNKESFMPAFKRAVKLKIRVNDSYCKTETFEFNMSGSTSAINFMTK